jgi:hypothetical protein
MPIISPWYQLGYVIPHLYTDMDAYQFYHVAPEGMMLVTTGINLREYSLAAVESELPALWQRFELLAKKKVDRISLSGVPVASALGRTKMLEILAEAQQRTGLQCDTDLEAHIATLKHLGATRIALATRWPEAVNSALTRYLGEAGIEVLACAARGRTLDQNKTSSAADDHLLALELGGQALRAAACGSPCTRCPCSKPSTASRCCSTSCPRPGRRCMPRVRACSIAPIRAGAWCWPVFDRALEALLT